MENGTRLSRTAAMKLLFPHSSWSMRVGSWPKHVLQSSLSSSSDCTPDFTHSHSLSLCFYISEWSAHCSSLQASLSFYHQGKDCIHCWIFALLSPYFGCTYSWDIQYPYFKGVLTPAEATRALWCLSRLSRAYTVLYVMHSHMVFYLHEKWFICLHCHPPLVVWK